MHKLTKTFLLSGIALSLSACSVIQPSTQSPIGWTTKVQGEKVDVTKAIDAYHITPALVKELAPKIAMAKSIFI